MEKSVNVEFTGPFRELTGQRETSIPLEDKISLIELIEKLSLMFGGKLKEKIIEVETGELNGEEAMVFINGRIIPPGKGSACEVKSGDKIVFALPLAGGG